MEVDRLTFPTGGSSHSPAGTGTRRERPAAGRKLVCVMNPANLEFQLHRSRQTSSIRGGIRTTAIARQRTQGGHFGTQRAKGLLGIRPICFRARRRNPAVCTPRLRPLPQSTGFTLAARLPYHHPTNTPISHPTSREPVRRRRRSDRRRRRRPPLAYLPVLTFPRTV